MFSGISQSDAAGGNRETETETNIPTIIFLFR